MAVIKNISYFVKIWSSAPEKNALIRVPPALTPKKIDTFLDAPCWKLFYRYDYAATSTKIASPTTFTKHVDN